jgi:hypothetical protein
MKLSTKASVVCQTSEQLAALIKISYKTGITLLTEKSFDYYYLLYQAIEEEKVSPHWFIEETLRSDLQSLYDLLEKQREQHESTEVEEQILTVRFFMDEVDTLLPKESSEFERPIEYYKASSELREILGSEWLIQKDRVTIDTLKNFITSQVNYRNLKVTGNKVFLDDYFKHILQTQQEYMFHDQILRKLKEGLIKI